MSTDKDHRIVILERLNRERQYRIQSILDAAKKVFFTKGFIKTSMDEIALEAEVSKPTVYSYFNTKDDLFFSLMLPVLDHLGRINNELKKKLLAKKYESGEQFLHDFFEACYSCYEKEPDVFTIIQLFQQSGLVWTLNASLQKSMNEKGKSNFEGMRELLELAMEQELIRKMDVFQLSDVLWGLVVGIIQLENIKSQSNTAKQHLIPTLQLAEQIIFESIVVKKPGT